LIFLKVETMGKIIKNEQKNIIHEIQKRIPKSLRELEKLKNNRFHIFRSQVNHQISFKN